MSGIRLAEHLGGCLFDVLDDGDVLEQGVQLQLDLRDGRNLIPLCLHVEIRRVQATTELAPAFREGMVNVRDNRGELSRHLLDRFGLAVGDGNRPHVNDRGLLDAFPEVLGCLDLGSLAGQDLDECGGKRPEGVDIELVPGEQSAEPEQAPCVALLTDLLDADRWKRLGSRERPFDLRVTFIGRKALAALDAGGEPISGSGSVRYSMTSSSALLS